MRITIDIDESAVDKWGYLYFAVCPNRNFNPGIPESVLNKQYNALISSDYSLPGFEYRSPNGKDVFIFKVEPSPIEIPTPLQILDENPEPGQS